MHLQQEAQDDGCPQSGDEVCFVGGCLVGIVHLTCRVMVMVSFSIVLEYVTMVTVVNGMHTVSCYHDVYPVDIFGILYMVGILLYSH